MDLMIKTMLILVQGSCSVMGMARPALLWALLMACACGAAAQAPVTETPAQTPITEALLQQAGIIPDVIRCVAHPWMPRDVAWRMPVAKWRLMSHMHRSACLPGSFPAACQ